MFAFLKSRTFLIVVGLVLVALLIWFLGPYFAFGSYKPLESEIARVIAILLVVVALVVIEVLKRVRANQASDKLMAGVVAQSQGARPSAEATQLRERFETAVATLKQSRRGGHSLYDLPWYVIIGAPGSGKTTALVNSGLNFPLEQRSGKAALRGIGGTRNCDWWFTDEAIFLDTAGRYTTQDSDADSDSAAWSEFLSLLRTYRKRRPLNGVILTVSAQDLLTQNSAAREAYVTAARRRLSELNKELKITLPVYVMVTKCDLVAGFAEYFDDLDRDGRMQVWGVTFPYDDTRTGRASASFASDLDALIARLNERLLVRVKDERDQRRRTRIFGFPQQMNAMSAALTEFVGDVFASTRFDQPVLLRGVYFTSGTQEGTPIDRLLGALGRRFAVASEAMIASGGRGKAYFIERLLKDVLLAESGLAGVNRRHELQKAAAQLGAYIAIGLLAVLGVVLLSVSFSRNRSYIDQVAASVQPMRAFSPIAGASLDAVLPRLEALRHVDDVANQYKEHAPWSMRWGLFEGDSIGDAARGAYLAELNGVMLPTVAERFRRRMMSYGAEPEKLYPFLKAYLMLGDSKHLNPKELETIADIEWQSAYSDARLGAVTNHFHSLLTLQDPVPSIDDLDQTVIAQARSTLRQKSQGGLVYRYVQLRYANDATRDLHLDEKAGIGAERVLRRKSGISLKTPIPSIFTKPVFFEITSKGTDDLVTDLTKESWVWGSTPPAMTGSSIRDEFLDVYEKEYISAWDRLVGDIQVAPLGSMSATKEAIDILSAPTGPLRGILQVIDDNTYMVVPKQDAEKPGGGGGLQTTIKSLFDSGKKAAGVSVAVPGTKITAHFEQFHKLVAGEKGSAPIDGVLQKLRELQQKMQPVGEAVGNTNVNNPQAINSIGQTANELKREAAPLPPSIGEVVTKVADGAAAAVRGGVRSTLESRYQQEVVDRCRQIASGRYPFVAGSSSDVPLADFGQLFGTDGVYDTFFKNELAPLVDTTRTPFTWKADESGAQVGGSTSMLRQFEAANRIREAYFRGSRTPEVRFNITPDFLDPTSRRFVLDVEGVTMVYRFDSPRTISVVWPGQKPVGVSATFEDSALKSSGLSFQGPWAWFRLIDAGVLQPDSQAPQTRFDLTLEAGGHKSKVIIDAQSILNPFARRELQQFSCQ